VVNTRPFANPMNDWKCPKCNFYNFGRNDECKKCQEERPDGGGVAFAPARTSQFHDDWYCEDASCQYLNFARNDVCRMCSKEKPENPRRPRSLDWICPECKYNNFQRNQICKQCSKPIPPEIRDWRCTQCDFVNFGRNRACLKCKEKKPDKPLLETVEDWLCDKCKFVNFAKRTECYKCGGPPVKAPVYQKKAAKETDDGVGGGDNSSVKKPDAEKGNGDEDDKGEEN